MLIELSEFHTMVEDALGRPSLNSRVPLRVAMAANWLERNYTFQYMRTWRSLTALATADYPYIITQSGLNIKGIELMRIKQTDADTGDILFNPPLKKVHPGDRERRGVGIPESYWINGRSSIILNSIPEEDTDFELHLQEFTSWNYEQDGFTHWLLDNATQLLLCRTLLIMAVGPAKDPDLYQLYKTEFDLEINTFTISEEEIQTGEVVQVWEPPEYNGSDSDSLRST